MTIFATCTAKGCVLGLTLLGAGCASLPEGGQPRQALQLIGKMKAACGGKAWERVQGWHETGTVDLPGRPGVAYETYHSMRSPTMVTRSRVGGQIVMQRGYNGTIGWQAGPDGRPRIETDSVALRKMRRDAYLSSFGWFLRDRMPAAFSLTGVVQREGRIFDVLRIVPADAEPFDLWVDRADSRVSRIIAGKEYAELSNYRDFGGICSATLGRQGDGDPARDIVLHVRSVDTSSSIPATTFQPPA